MKPNIHTILCVSVFCVFALQGQADTIFTADLTGAGDGVNTPATGTATVDVNSALTQISYSINFSNLTSDATMGHIHYGAAGVSGPILLWFFPATLTPTPTSTSGSYSGTWTASDLASQTTDPAITTFATLLNDMQSGDTYVNVHTVNYPAGEIRGQLMLTPEPAAWSLLGIGFVVLAGFRRRLLARG